MNAIVTRTYGYNLLCLALLLVLPSAAAQTSPQPSPGTKDSSEPAVTFKTATRMVTVEVVAKDRQGQHVRGLTAADFQVLEQAPNRSKEKHAQKIVAFREVRVNDLASQTGSEIQKPAGVYTNLVTLQKNPVPPTIILVDGLNTAPEHQAQVHVQMLKMLRALPKDVPVAVFLLGHNLRLVQGLTNDPSILQTALDRLPTITAGVGEATMDPRDDPDTASAQLEAMNQSGGRAVASAEVIEGAKRFEQFIYAAQMDRRVRETIDALSTLGRHLGGYPGRKNLLWISSAFPIALQPIDYVRDDLGLRNYSPQLRTLSSVLSEAKVAVYPINPAGVQANTFYAAGTRPRDLSGPGTTDTLGRENLLLADQYGTMQVLAEGTGGRVCTGDNDLGDCVHKAVDDSSEFYELAYYPDSHNWNGEYRAITVKTKQPGLHLAYRQGYYTNPEGGSGAKQEAAELQSACRDYLDATAIPIAAKIVPDNAADKTTFTLTLRLSDLTLTPASDGSRNLNVALAVCTFQRDGTPGQLLQYPMDRKLTADEFKSLEAAGSLSESLFIPGPKPALFRLLVKDVPSGRLGSLRIRMEGNAPTPTVAAPGNGM